MEIKLPIYDWVVKFLNGVLAIVLCAVLDANFFLSIVRSGLVQELLSKPELIVLSVAFAVAYEIGSLFDRLGSLLESFFKKIKFIPFNDDYVRYNRAKAEFPVMATLQKNYAVSRTQFALFTTFSVAFFVVSNWVIAIVPSLVALVQFFSWRKFAKKIVDLMNSEDVCSLMAEKSF